MMKAFNDAQQEPTHANTNKQTQQRLLAKDKTTKKQHTTIDKRNVSGAENTMHSCKKRCWKSRMLCKGDREQHSTMDDRFKGDMVRRHDTFVIIFCLC